jgi:O-antigen/teichoic acid export membrane protein
MLPEKDKDARNLLVGSLVFVGLFTLLTALGVILLGEAVLELLRAPQLGPFLWMLPIAVLANGSYLALRYWNTRVKHFGLLSRVRVASSVGQVSTKLGMGFLGFAGPGSLIGAGVLGYIVSAAGLGWRTWRENQHFSSQTSWRQIARQLERYRKFPLVSTWSGLLNTLSVQLPVMLLSVFFTQTVVGFYSFGIRMVGLPMTLIGNAVGQVFFQRASEARNQGTLDLVVQNTYERLVKLGLFPLIVLGLIGPELFLVVFGPEWVEAGVYTQIVSLWRFFVFVGSPMSTQ